MSRESAPAPPASWGVRKVLSSLITVVLSTAIALGGAELVLRAKNASMKSYDIEMWRYARDLERRSDIPAIDHEHVPLRSAVLESVDIRINERGLRGGPLPAPRAGQRRILFLGGSVTLGWGVPEADTVTARLERMLRADGEDVVVMNAGTGNYNAVRYVARFERQLSDLAPTDLVVHYFPRDAEVLEPGGDNWLLRHSELAVTMWIALTRHLGKATEETPEQHYRRLYQPDAPGYVAMRGALHELAGYAREHGIRIYLAMIPETHELAAYPLSAVHDLMREVGREEGYRYVELLPALRNLTPAELWVMPGDPHPNALGHRLMAEALHPALALGALAPPTPSTAAR